MNPTPTAPATDDELRRSLADGVGVLGLPVAPAQLEALVCYIRLIERWSSAYNLTAIRDPRSIVTHHLLDCLAAAASLRRRRGETPERVLDVGSGAGLPGVVLALALPEREVTCVDSVGKKAAFITQAAGSLGLKNVTARQVRVENLRAPAFDVITSRALASLDVFVGATRHLLAPDGEWMALKGHPPEAEITALQGVGFHVEPLDVPGLDAERCIVWMVNNASAHF